MERGLDCRRGHVVSAQRDKGLIDAWYAASDRPRFTAPVPEKLRHE